MHVVLKAADAKNKKLTIHIESLAESKEELQRRYSQLAEVGTSGQPKVQSWLLGPALRLQRCTTGCWSFQG